MANLPKDVTITDNHPKTLLLKKHVEYIASYGNNKDDYVRTFSVASTIFIRLTLMLRHKNLMNKQTAFDDDNVITGIRKYDMKLPKQQQHQSVLDEYGGSHRKHSRKEYCMTEYLRMSGMYWGLTAMDLMGNLQYMDRAQIIEFIEQCIDPNTGGISSSIGHDPHLLYTLSAVQILCILDSVSVLPVDKVVQFVASLQQPDGSFTGDKWGEVDTRFSFCAVVCLSLLGRLDAIDVEKAVDFVLSCYNFDGGFGSQPGSESHAGMIYCCVGFLSITGRLDSIDGDLLGWWLSERQLPSGGLNGRPEKLPDVCYSWWVLASLTILGRLHWVHQQSLEKFILACQDTETGGFSDRPGDLPDPFHTLFGVAGLSLLGNEQLVKVNPTYCMPQYIIDKLNLRPQMLSI